MFNLRKNERQCIFEGEIVKLPSNKFFVRMGIKIQPKSARKGKELLFVSKFVLRLNSNEEQRFLLLRMGEGKWKIFCKACFKLGNVVTFFEV